MLRLTFTQKGVGTRFRRQRSHVFNAPEMRGHASRGLDRLNTPAISRAALSLALSRMARTILRFDGHNTGLIFFIAGSFE